MSESLLNRLQRPTSSELWKNHELTLQLYLQYVYMVQNGTENSFAAIFFSFSRKSFLNNE